jgi:hypothetical protein
MGRESLGVGNLVQEDAMTEPTASKELTEERINRIWIRHGRMNVTLPLGEIFWRDDHESICIDFNDGKSQINIFLAPAALEFFRKRLPCQHKDAALADRKKVRMPSIAGELIDREYAEDEVYPSLQSEQPGQSVGQEEREEMVKAVEDALYNAEHWDEHPSQGFLRGLRNARALILAPPAKTVSREELGVLVGQLVMWGRGGTSREQSGIPSNQTPQDYALERLRELGLEVEDEQ